MVSGSPEPAHGVIRKDGSWRYLRPTSSIMCTETKSLDKTSKTSADRRLKKKQSSCEVMVRFDSKNGDFRGNAFRKICYNWGTAVGPLG